MAAIEATSGKYGDIFTDDYLVSESLTPRRANRCGWPRCGRNPG
jgi:hypothetical protein